jgi:hypothetical protein
MIKRETPMSSWPAYLEAIREEVREGVGIFSEDDHLRMLFEECFDRGDALTGTVRWSEGWRESFSDL